MFHLQSSSHLQDDASQNSASSGNNKSAGDGSSDRGDSVDSASFQCAVQEPAQSSSSNSGIDGVSASCDGDVADYLSASAASLGEDTSLSETMYQEDPDDMDDNCANDDANGSESDKQGAPNDFKYFAKLSGETLPHEKTTKAQALLLVMAYIVTAGFTWAQVRGLLILLNTLFGEAAVPSTTYLLRKLWKDKKEALRIYLYCQHCHDDLRIFQEMPAKSQVICGGCNLQRTTKELVAAGSFFDMFDLRQQLTDLIKYVSGPLLRSLQKLSASRELGMYSDITDGDLYRSIRRQMNMAWSELTLTFNTDNAPVFDSSKSFIWSIQVMINELRFKIRSKNIALSGLWFAKEHPPMQIFLRWFVEEVRVIGTLVWSHAEAVIKSPVHEVLCCVVSPARASILNMKQFNGYYWCS